MHKSNPEWNYGQVHLDKIWIIFIKSISLHLQYKRNEMKSCSIKIKPMIMLLALFNHV